jgi:hypothetical protein
MLLFFRRTLSLFGNRPTAEDPLSDCRRLPRLEVTGFLESLMTSRIKLPKYEYTLTVVFLSLFIWLLGTIIFVPRLMDHP